MNSSENTVADFTWRVSPNEDLGGRLSDTWFCKTCGESGRLEVEYGTWTGQTTQELRLAVYASHRCTKDLSAEEFQEFLRLCDPEHQTDSGVRDDICVKTVGQGKTGKPVLQAPDWDEESLRQNFPDYVVEGVLDARANGFYEGDITRGVRTYLPNCERRRIANEPG